MSKKKQKTKPSVWQPRDVLAVIVVSGVMGMGAWLLSNEGERFFSTMWVVIQAAFMLAMLHYFKTKQD